MTGDDLGELFEAPSLSADVSLPITGRVQAQPLDQLSWEGF